MSGLLTAEKYLKIEQLTGNLQCKVRASQGMFKWKPEATILICVQASVGQNFATVILHPGGKVEQFKQETQLWVQVETAAVAGSSLSRM